MGNTLRSLVSNFPDIITVEAPPNVETKAVDLFDQAIRDANANATAGVVNEVAQAAQESNDVTNAILANIINQKCDGDEICSNIEMIMGDVGNEEWQNECQKKVFSMRAGRARFGLKDGTRSENEASRRKCEDGNTMCTWSSSQTSPNLFSGSCGKKSCSILTMNGNTVGEACGVEGKVKTLFDKGMRRVCWGVDSKTTRGCLEGDINDPLAPTVDKGCMRFVEKKEAAETCETPLKDSNDPQESKLLRQCMDFVGKEKAVVTWSGLLKSREEMERLDRLMYASHVEEKADKCPDYSPEECQTHGNECQLLSAGICTAREVDRDARANECSRMRSVTACSGEYCAWNGTACAPNRELVRRRRTLLKQEIRQRMDQNTKEFCLNRMCVKGSGFRATCIPYFDRAGNTQDCPEGFAERPTDIHGRRYPAPDCAQANAACRDAIGNDLLKDFDRDLVQAISQTVHTGINRGISQRECLNKGCEWRQNTDKKCFKAGTNEPCNNCLIKNVDQKNVRLSERNATTKSVVENKIQDVDLVNIQESLRNVAAQATGGFDLTKLESVQNIASKCMDASSEIENKVRQDCLKSDSEKDGFLLMNLINQSCKNVEKGCEISDIQQSSELRTTESCLQNVEISNQTLQSMRQAIRQVGIKTEAGFENSFIKMIVWGTVVIASVVSVGIWAVSKSALLAIAPIVIGALIIFVTGMNLKSDLNSNVNHDRYMTYASVRRSDDEKDPFGCGVSPFDSFDNVTLKEAGDVCNALRCKSYYWEANDDKEPRREPVEFLENSTCSETNFPCCPSICIKDDVGFCEPSKCCPSGYRKVVEREGRYARVNCIQCDAGKTGTVYMYDEDLSDTQPQCMEGLHQPENIGRDDLQCLTNVKTWAVFAKPTTTDVTSQGRLLAKNAVKYGAISIVGILVADVAMKRLYNYILSKGKK